MFNMRWQEIENDFDRFDLDRSFISKNLLSREKVRIVKYPHLDIPIVYYIKMYKIFSFKSDFKPKYPILSRFFTLLGIRDINYNEK